MKEKHSPQDWPHMEKTHVNRLSKCLGTPVSKEPNEQEIGRRQSARSLPTLLGRLGEIRTSARTVEMRHFGLVHPSETMGGHRIEDDINGQRKVV
ncbi:unnamed protein product [Protopolystoma xenopodis]|uniref:Uncharacterized protein n=1 Tax=Protopolystoma xenopodis TaxID=117903 RepID=A0A448XAF2_9PLAT|nr:unnamed protein product [Protopolystoma xenopodis]